MAQRHGFVCWWTARMLAGGGLKNSLRNIDGNRHGGIMSRQRASFARGGARCSRRLLLDLFGVTCGGYL
jgi:hypothetical protein